MCQSQGQSHGPEPRAHGRSMIAAIAIAGIGLQMALSGCNTRSTAPANTRPARAETASLEPATVPAVQGNPANDPAPPLLTVVYPGAPCALTAAGRCRGGRGGDEPYLPFTLPANRPIDVMFDRPMAAATLVLGTGCGSGAVRIETLGPGGTCTGVVPGTMTVRERGLRFWPATPWVPGRSYRLILAAGTDDRCDPGELCSRDGLPLNTDPLEGAAGSGGPPAVMMFTGAPASDNTYALLRFVPAADNRVAAAITGRGGIVQAVSIDQPDCLPATAEIEGCVQLAADLAVSVGPVRTSCIIGQNEQGQSIMVPACLPVRIFPAILYGSPLILDARVSALGTIDDLSTGRQVMRLGERGGTPISGYIIRRTGAPGLWFVADLDLYMDAPDLSILGGAVRHDLRSKSLSMRVEGPVTLVDDRVGITLTNTTPTPLRVNVSALLSGRIDMLIPAGTMRLELTGEQAAGLDIRDRLP